MPLFAPVTVPILVALIKEYKKSKATARKEKGGKKEKGVDKVEVEESRG